MSITAITLTGDRNVAFSLCRLWVKNQNVRPTQWIVVDDGSIPMRIEKQEGYLEYVRRTPKSTDPKFTLIENMLTAIPRIKGEKILIMEDDEYYAPEYIEEMSKRLDSYEIAGVGCAKYYHLPTGGYIQHKNMEHASLAETGFRSSFLPSFIRCAQQGMDQYWLDDRLWKAVKEGKKNGLKAQIFVDADRPLYVGMKGLPGRKGIGIGHNPFSYKGRADDINRSVLKKWIPKDHQIYLDLLLEMKH